MPKKSPLNTSEWIAYVDQLRDSDPLLQAGAWHGYLNERDEAYKFTDDPENWEPPNPAHPLRGRYVLARWRPADRVHGGTIVIADDNPTRVVLLARRLEEGFVLDSGMPPHTTEHTRALCAAAMRVRDGRWWRGAATHVFAELLQALEADGWRLIRSKRR